VKVRRIVLWVLLAALMTGTASGQESLQSAKDLYASAAYEDALAVLGRNEVLAGRDLEQETKVRRRWQLRPDALL